MPCRLLWGTIWAVSLFLLLATVHVAFAQEPIPEAQDRGRATVPEGGDAEAAAQSDEPALLEGDEETVRRRRLLKRLGPQQLTLEQQEEATRLSGIAAKMGTDPTAIIGRVQTLYRHNAFSGGVRSNNLVGRIDIPYRGTFVLRADVPYAWLDPNRPGAANQDGLSDLFVRAGGRVYTIPGYSFFAGTDFTFPTADSPQLGLGKYTLGPLFATARVLPDFNSFIFGVLQHQFSVGGDPSRKDISISRVALTVNTIWGEQWWTQIEAVNQVNWEQDAKDSMTLEFEAGSLVSG